MHLTPHEWVAVAVAVALIVAHHARRRRRGRRSSLTLTEYVRLPFGLSLRLRKRL